MYRNKNGKDMAAEIKLWLESNPEIENLIKELELDIISTTC